MPTARHVMELGYPGRGDIGRSDLREGTCLARTRVVGHTRWALLGGFWVVDRDRGPMVLVCVGKSEIRQLS